MAKLKDRSVSRRSTAPVVPVPAERVESLTAWARELFQQGVADGPWVSRAEVREKAGL